MKNAIVTGGSGFIGSWLIDELIKNEVNVTAIVRSKSRFCPGGGIWQETSRLKIIESEIGNVSAADLDAGYDCFFHLAWNGVSPEQKNDLDVQLSNTEIAAAALSLCRKTCCRLFLAAGTVAEYSYCNNVIDVYARQTPGDLYGAAKVSVHCYLEVLARQMSQPFIWAVLPSTFGERRADNNILTYTIRSLLRGERPVYGTLEQMWDFLYVEDTVRALRLIAEKGTAGKVYGVGSGRYEPLKNYVMRIRDQINSEAELGIGELQRQPGQVFSSCVNIYDLVRDTGFAPQNSFDEGISKMIEWMRHEL